MPGLMDQLRQASFGRSPLIFIHTPEEGRAVEGLEELAKEFAGDDAGTYVWDCVNGFVGLDGAKSTSDPVAALEAVLATKAKGFFVMRDLSELMDSPAVVRALRNTYYALRDDPGKAVVILSPELRLPTILQKEIYVVEMAPPQDEELLEHVRSIEAGYESGGVPEELYADIALALRGLTVNEVEHIMHRVLHRGQVTREEILDEIFNEKEMIVKKSGFLEFVPPRQDISQMGGVDELKEWLISRAKVFNRDAVEAGLPIPKGILLMGVSGCGKSLAAKVVSSLWNVPLYRLDMNLVFSGMYGSPEAAFHHALRTVESVAPAVLWIDEIENAMDMGTEGSTEQAHMFSTFLTWMQEKPPLVFIAATANRIESLPAEVIRKGRFDQIFFVDLPTEKERREILEIHLRNHGANTEDFDLEYLLVATDEWNGAEIEQAIVSARVEAYADGQRAFTTRDVSNSALSIVPLARTMKEQIKLIRNWAYGRATPASKYGRRAYR